MATTYKVLGQSSPTTTAEATLYTVPASTSTVVSTLVISNLTSTQATATVNVGVAGATSANLNTLLKAVPIAGNSVATFTIGITLATTDLIKITSGTANALTFQAFGSEIS
jgi:hypothetical protein